MPEINLPPEIFKAYEIRGIVGRTLEAEDVGRGSGTYRAQDIGNAYIERIASDVKLKRKMKIAVDCGNGVAGAFAPTLYRCMGCDVTELYCEVDGNFPHHHPDP